MMIMASVIEQASERGRGEEQWDEGRGREICLTHLLPVSLNKLVINVASHHVMADNHPL